MKSSKFLLLFLISIMISSAITLISGFAPSGKVVAMDYTNFLTDRSRLQLSAVVNRGYYVVELNADRSFSYVLEARIGEIYFSLKGNSNGRLVVPLKVSESGTSVGIIADIETESVKYASLRLVAIGDKFGLWWYMLGYFSGFTIYVIFLEAIFVLGVAFLENLRISRYASFSTEEVTSVKGDVFLDVWMKPMFYIYGSFGVIIFVLVWLLIGPTLFDVVTSGIPQEILGLTPTDFAVYWFSHILFHGPQLVLAGLFIVFGKTRLVLWSDNDKFYIHYLGHSYGFDIDRVTPICDVEPPECKLRLDLEKDGVQVRVFEIVIDCSEAYKVCQKFDELLKQS